MADHFELPPDKAVTLLGRLMLAWDGQWFLKTAEACGVETAVALNARVRTSFGRIEIREFLKAKGHPGAATVEEAVSLVREYQHLFLGDGIAAGLEVDGDRVSVEVSKCAPQMGAGKAGLRPDTPCVACDTVWTAWFETAMPGSRWTSGVKAAMGRGAPSCLIVLEKEPR